jgi:glutathione synthase/RimK-type ligase-like ATP-grasp enzyme
LDLAQLERQQFKLKIAEVGTTFSTTSAGSKEDATVGQGTRGWIRRLAEPDWRQDASPGTYGGVVRTAWINLLVALAQGLQVEWLTALDALTAAENKALQLLVGQRSGIPIPLTAIVNDRGNLPAELGDPVVVKPLGPGAYREEGEAMRVVHAHLVDRASEILDALPGAPFLVQERLVVERHLRVVTVNERAWCFALDAHDLPLDWRRHEAAHDSFRATTEYAEVASQALRLARALRAGYSSQDWVVDDESVWFLDFNPGGQWLFLPRPGSDEVTEAIASWLAGDD